MLRTILCLLLPLLLAGGLRAQKNKKRPYKKNPAHISHHQSKAHTHRKNQTTQKAPAYKKEHQTSKKFSQNHDKKGRTILTGPRGGRYYINSKGNKVYVPKS